MPVTLETKDDTTLYGMIRPTSPEAVKAINEQLPNLTPQDLFVACRSELKFNTSDIPHIHLENSDITINTKDKKADIDNTIFRNSCFKTNNISKCIIKDSELTNIRYINKNDSKLDIQNSSLVNIDLTDDIELQNVKAYLYDKHSKVKRFILKNDRIINTKIYVLNYNKKLDPQEAYFIKDSIIEYAAINGQSKLDHIILRGNSKVELYNPITPLDKKGAILDINDKKTQKIISNANSLDFVEPILNKDKELNKGKELLKDTFYIYKSYMLNEVGFS